MKKSISTVGAALLVAAAVGGSALAQTPATPQETKAPQTLEGEVVKVDQKAGKVTVRGADGTLYEFQASKETLRDLKPGDKIEAKRR